MADTGRSTNRPGRSVAVALAVLVGLAVPTWIQLMPSWDRIDEQVAPDRGDPVLLMWVMGSVVADQPATPATLLDGNIFHPYDDVLAWSDNLVVFAPVYGVARAVASGNPVVAFNVVSFLAYLAGALSVFALARWLTRSTLGGFTAGLLFTASPYRSVSVGHMQLAGCFAVALALLFLLRLLRHRRLGDAVALGVSVALAWYTAAYFAVFLAVVLPVVALVWLVQGLVRPASVRRPGVDRPLVEGGLLAGVVTAVLVAPSAPAYLRLQELDVFDRTDATVARGRWSYLAELPPSPLYQALFDQAPRIGDKGGWFPGLLMVLLLVAGVALVVRDRLRPSARPDGDSAADPESSPPSRLREAGLPLLAGAGLSLLLAFGPASRPWSYPFRILRRLVPGMESIRDTGRFWLAVLIVLSCLAAAALVVVGRRVAGGSGWSPRWSVLIAVVLVVVVLAESVYRPRFVTIDRSEETLAVYRALAELPPGVTTEAPPAMVTPEYPFVAAGRQLNSLIDGKPRIEGYSGAAPPDLPLFETAKLDLADRETLILLQRFGVRYVVLHVGDGACAGHYAPDEAAALVDALSTRDQVAAISEVAGSRDVIVELAPADRLVDRPVRTTTPADPVARALACDG